LNFTITDNYKIITLTLMLRHHDNYIIFTKKTLIKFMVGVIEKKSKKRKGESSISERESVEEKCKINGHDNQNKSET